MARLDRLGSVREVAQLAATIGRDFSYDLLRVISPLDDSGLRNAMAALVDAEVLYQRGLMPQARYFFKHALIRDAAYESLLKSKRQQVHSRIARVLEEQFPETTEVHPELVAHHYSQAGLAAQAIPYWQKAGEKALQRAAFAEAINYCTQALSLLPEWISESQLDQQQRESGELRCALLLAMGQAQRRGGQPVKARQTLLRAIEIAHGLSSADLVSRVAYQQMRLRAHFGLSPGPTATRLLEETLTRLGAGDSPPRARMLAALSDMLVRAGATERAFEYGSQGAAMARRLGDAELLAANLHSITASRMLPEHAGQSRLYAAEELEAAKAANLPEDVWRARWSLVYSALQLGDVVSAKRDLKDLALSANELREPFLSCLVKNFQACEASIQGRFDDCERLAYEALAIGQTLEIENAAGVFGVQMFTLRREQGRLREIEPLLRHFVQTPEGAHAWLPGLALIYSELGRTTEARAVFEQPAASDFAGIPRDSNRPVCLSYLADVCTFLGDITRALTLYELMSPYKGINILIASGSACYGSASRYLGALATTMRRWDQAERHFEDALAMNSAMGAHPWLAHTQYQYATMLLSRDQPGDSVKASALLKEALATARELGMRSLEEHIASGAA
jgi:tetratricopeptide (TPR) repeat protein